jgi:hypothetical protein
MNDRHAQFLIIVADACSGAALAELSVEVVTVDGLRHRGVPAVLEVDHPDAVDGGSLRVDGRVVALARVVELVVRPPREVLAAHGR